MTVPQSREVLEEYFAAVCGFDADTAVTIVMTLLGRGASPGWIVDEVIGPVQIRVGELWERGQWTYADEHAVTAVTERVVAALSDAVAPPRPQGPRVLFASADGDLHSLPAQMAALIAASAGARVTMLSSPLNVERLVDRLVARDVDLLALSCTMALNLVGAARCIQAAHAVGVPVLVGGRAFGGDADRARATGADGFASSWSALPSPPSGVARPVEVLPPEALLLDGITSDAVERAHVRTMEQWGLAPGLDSAQLAVLREYLEWVARHAGAALAVRDAVVLDEFMSWWRKPSGHRTPSAVLLIGARMMADVVEPEAPEGARLLRAAAARADAAPEERQR